MLTVYLDFGGYEKSLEPLRNARLIRLISADIDGGTGTKVSRYVHKVKATLPVYEKDRGSYADATGTYADDDNASEQFENIRKIVGRGNIKDARHLDTAYRNKSSVYITSDKGDIWNHRVDIEALLNLVVLRPCEIPQLEAMCRDC